MQLFSGDAAIVYVQTGSAPVQVAGGPDSSADLMKATT